MVFFIIILLAVLMAVGLSISLTVTVTAFLDWVSRRRRISAIHVGPDGVSLPRCSCSMCRTGLPNGTVGLAGRGSYRVDVGGAQ